jgi:membrane-bound lytic murein transglycosylase D
MIKKNLIYIVTGLFILVTAWFSIFAIIEKKNSDQDYRDLFNRHYRIFTPEIPKNADFAGETVPLDRFYVKESLEREILINTYMHASTIMMFKRAYRWFPVIEPILKKNNVPDDFKFLALAESNLVNSVSPSGAEGFWQFLKPTGLQYGLEITEEVDERYNVEKATEAACKYFREAFNKYNSWTLVAASFNRGQDGVSKAIEKQKVDNYYDLYLVDETARYVYRIIALKEIYSHPTRYGLYLRENDFYPTVPVNSVTIDSTITDLADFAFRQKINYRILRDLNPWIRRYNLPNKSGKTYTFYIPKEGSINYESLMKKMPKSEVFFHDTLKINQIH